MFTHFAEPKQPKAAKRINQPLIKNLPKNSKNSPSKLEGAPEGEGVCLCCKVLLFSVVSYKVDSYIFVWRLIASLTLPNTKMSE